MRRCLKPEKDVVSLPIWRLLLHAEVFMHCQLREHAVILLIQRRSRMQRSLPHVEVPAHAVLPPKGA